MENRIFIMFALNASAGGDSGLQRGPSLYFNSLQQAESAASCYRTAYSSLYEGVADPLVLYCLVVEEYQTGSLFPERISTRVYSPEGVPMDTSPFHVGDIIESPFGEHLQLGIVLEGPTADGEDCYTVLAYPSMDVEYLQNTFLFAPRQAVDRSIQSRLHEELDTYLTDCRKDEAVLK